MNQELIFETRQQQTVVRADSLHRALGVMTDLRLWVIMHTAAGAAEQGVDVFHDGQPEAACWSLDFATQVAMLEHTPDIAEQIQQLTWSGRPLKA